jgi:excisionase family DNA binding protein
VIGVAHHPMHPTHHLGVFLFETPYAVVPSGKFIISRWLEQGIYRQFAGSPEKPLNFPAKPRYKQGHRFSAGILPGVSAMRSSAARSNLLVPEIREVMDIRQASDYLGISPDTLYKYASEGFVPAFKLGNRWRFKRSRLDEWMDHQSEMQAAEFNPDMKKPVKPAM